MKRGGTNYIVNTKLNGVLTSISPTGDKAVKTFLAGGSNQMKIWLDFTQSLKHNSRKHFYFIIFFNQNNMT